MIFVCFVNLNFLIRIVNVFLLKVKTNNAWFPRGEPSRASSLHAFKIFDFNSEALDCNPKGYNIMLRTSMICYRFVPAKVSNWFYFFVKKKTPKLKKSLYAQPLSYAFKILAGF